MPKFNTTTNTTKPKSPEKQDDASLSTNILLIRDNHILLFKIIFSINCYYVMSYVIMSTYSTNIL